MYNSQNRQCYILVLIDYFSKFVVTKACTSVNSAKMIEFLNCIFGIFGHCTVLTTDNGPQFISHNFTEYLKRKGIIHRRSSLYNPQANGVVERVNRNLKKLIDTNEITNINKLQDILDNFML